MPRGRRNRWRIESLLAPVYDGAISAGLEGAAVGFQCIASTHILVGRSAQTSMRGLIRRGQE